MKFKKLDESLIDEIILENLSKTFCIDKKVIQILYSRGFNTKEKIEKFLNDDINNLKDPFLLKNMDNVAKRVNLAIEKNEKILIFGDYDVDGICAVSILYNYLIDKTKNVTTYLPNRFEDGYGLSCPCIDKIAIKEKPNLIITVDCGISCEKEVQYIKEMGIDIIVTDHHELPEKLPDCLILNPKFEQEYNFNGLCGAGVSFKLVQALCLINRESFERFLPICALATIADIVPLIDDNRIIVKEGLKRLNLLPLGAKLLLKTCFPNLNNITSTDIAYKIAPKINSSGRLDDANIALNLFIKNDAKIINYSLSQLEYLNEKRKSICDNIFKDCKRMLNNTHNNVIILYKENWDIGVLGIVAAKLTEEFNKPVILFGKCNGELKGSGRSFGNIDIFKLFCACKDLLINFGGHTKAGGLSLKEEHLKNFKQSAEKYLSENYSSEDYKTIKNYDLELVENDITLDFANDLKKLEPFGFGNNIPVFLLNVDHCKVNKLKNFPNHITINLKNFNLLSFNDEKNFENYLNFSKKQILFELQTNEFKGVKSIKGIVRNCKFSNPNKTMNLKLQASYIKQLLYENEQTHFKQFNSINQLKNIIDNKTLIVTYKQDNKIFDEYWYTSFVLNKNFGETTVIFGLNSFDGLDGFNKIIFLERPINLAFLKEIKNYTNTEVYIPLQNNSLNIDFNLNREELLDIYYKLVKGINKNIYANELYSYFETLVIKFSLKTSFVKFYLSILIFEELKLIERVDDNLIKFKVNKIKTELENSKIFQKIKK